MAVNDDDDAAKEGQHCNESKLTGLDAVEFVPPVINPYTDKNMF